jgi:hypothetical protein
MSGVKVIASYDRVYAFLKEEPERQTQVLNLWKEQGGGETKGFMRGLVPVKTGFLRESITRRTTPKGFLVYATAPYAKFVDQGTAPHAIFPRGASVLRWFGPLGAPIFAKYVFHPGTAGHHFVQRTKEAMRQVLKQLYLAIWREQT